MKGTIATIFLVTTPTIVLAANCSAKQFQPIMQQRNAMVSCWNHSDLNCVVNSFYADDFIYMAKKPIHTKTQLLAHYKNNFKNQKTASLGKLKLTPLYCRNLGSDYISQLLHYNLSKNGKISTGDDILIWQKIAGRYKIITDFPRPSQQ